MEHTYHYKLDRKVNDSEVLPSEDILTTIVQGKDSHTKIIVSKDMIYLEAGSN